MSPVMSGQKQKQLNRTSVLISAETQLSTGASALWPADGAPALLLVPLRSKNKEVKKKHSES